MREIKFRAWQDGEMRMLDQVQRGVGQIGFSDTHYTDLSMDDDEPMELMQYTGLKDKNGQEIFEGDILNYPVILGDKLKTARGQVHYSVNIGSWFVADNNFGLALAKRSEVIGNIYENPELLKENN